MFTGEIAQAVDYKKIGEIAPEYSFLDELFERMFKQQPNERIYPEEKFLQKCRFWQKNKRTS